MLNNDDVFLLTKNNFLNAPKKVCSSKMLRRGGSFSEAPLNYILNLLISSFVHRLIGLLVCTQKNNTVFRHEFSAVLHSTCMGRDVSQEICIQMDPMRSNNHQGSQIKSTTTANKYSLAT